jgi:hypothetical protein
MSCAALAWAATAEASHQAGPYSVEILVGGVPQPVHYSGGQSFVAGSYGSAYEIRVHNHSGRRIEAVVAVDGRDVISGDPVSPRRHRGYLIGPYGSTSVQGFRTSTAQVATFRFSSIPESYAWRRGSSWGIGTVRVWVFEESRPVVVPLPRQLPHGAGRPRASRSAPSADLGMAAEAAPQAMGTAYGEQRWSPVSYTSFARRSRRAQAVMGIRYNSWDMLAAAGIVHAPQPIYPACPGCYQPTHFAPPPPPVYYRFH